MGVIRWARRLLALGIAIWALTIVAVIAAAVHMQARHGDGRSLAEPVDAAIVLGAGIDPDGVLSYSGRRRVAAGVRLLRDGKATHLIMSGGFVRPDGPVYGEAMRAYAVSLGAPADAILVEGRSRTTFENLRFSFPLAENAGLHRLAIVTDSHHLARADALAAYFGRPGIGLVAVSGLELEPWQDIAVGIGRESLAWWYNLWKIALWSIMEWMDVPPASRSKLVH